MQKTWRRGVQTRLGCQLLVMGHERRDQRETRRGWVRYIEEVTTVVDPEEDYVEISSKWVYRGVGG